MRKISQRSGPTNNKLAREEQYEDTDKHLGDNEIKVLQLQQERTEKVV